MENICILGICGTFMAGIAAIAKELNYKVCGIDSDVYPPMSEQLNDMGIPVYIGYNVEHIKTLLDTDFVVGNAISRGNPILEHLLDNRVNLISGPMWLKDNVLKDKWVLAVSGTHGKTTTASMLAWILEYAGLNPGFLIGGMPENFGISARAGKSNYFVIEADEYDSAFFDKRSKFIHYNPRTLIINNIEFDHSDIFRDIEDIKRQFHHLIRIMPKKGKIIYDSNDINIKEVLNLGVWSDIEATGQKGDNWYLNESKDILHEQKDCGRLHLHLLGHHNLQNALNAIAAANHVGVAINVAIEALSKFKGVKRRMELKDVVNNIEIYEDFAHHPTAIKSTIISLKKHYKSRVIAIVDIGSNTMRMGSHPDGALASSCMEADFVYWCHFKPVRWDVEEEFNKLQSKGGYFKDDLVGMVKNIIGHVAEGDKIILMSNSASNKILDKLIIKLNEHARIVAATNIG